MHTKVLFVLFSVSIATAYFIFPTTVFAQNTDTVGITVHPSLVTLDLATDAPQATLSYTNSTNQTLLLTFSDSDITETNDSYQLSFLDTKDARNFKYGLSSWLSFSSNSLLLAPHGSGSVTLFINSNTLSPGGHYGSVLATVEQTNSTNAIALKTVIATLIFVRTHTGKEFEKGSITTFSPEQTFFSLPTQFLLRFTNSGDTYVIPYGKVTLYDSFGQQVGNGTLNTGSLMVLPESLRRLEIPVHTFSNIVWPGIYHATLSVHFGKTNQKRSAYATFFSFGTLPVVPIVIVLLVVINGYLFWKKKRN